MGRGQVVGVRQEATGVCHNEGSPQFSKPLGRVAVAATTAPTSIIVCPPPSPSSDNHQWLEGVEIHHF